MNVLYNFQPIDMSLMSYLNPDLPLMEEDVQPAEAYTIYKGLNLNEGPFYYGDNLNYFEVAYYLVYGFINGTVGITSENATNCLDITSEYYWNTTIDVPWMVKGQYWT